MVRGETDDGGMLLTWTSTKGLTLLNNEEILTHDTGAVLNFCFTRHSSHTQCLIRYDLDTESDHRTLLTHVMDEGPLAQASDRIMHAAYN